MGVGRTGVEGQPRIYEVPAVSPNPPKSARIAARAQVALS